MIYGLPLFVTGPCLQQTDNVAPRAVCTSLRVYVLISCYDVLVCGNSVVPVVPTVKRPLPRIILLWRVISVLGSPESTNNTNKFSGCE